MDAGAEDASEEDGELIVYTEPKQLAKVRDNIIAGLTLNEAELTYIPKNTIVIKDPETARKVVALLDAIEDLDDVVNTHTNFDIAEGIEV